MTKSTLTHQPTIFWTPILLITFAPIVATNRLLTLQPLSPPCRAFPKPYPTWIRVPLLPPEPLPLTHPWSILTIQPHYLIFLPDTERPPAPTHARPSLNCGIAKYKPSHTSLLMFAFAQKSWNGMPLILMSPSLSPPEATPIEIFSPNISQSPP